MNVYGFANNQYYISDSWQQNFKYLHRIQYKDVEAVKNKAVVMY